MTAKRIVLMTLLGLAGLLLAVGITTAATQLTSQRIGLQEEPLTAGEELVPATATTEAETTPRTTRTEREETRTDREDDDDRPTTTADQAPPPATTPRSPGARP